MANEKSIAEEVIEVQALIKDVNKAVQALVNNPAFIRVTEFGMMLEKFTSGQPAAAPKGPTQPRTRRTAAEIALAKAAQTANETSK